MHFNGSLSEAAAACLGEREAADKVALTVSAVESWKLGVLADYRRAFWGYAWPRLREGRIEEIIATGIIAKHLITFARKACAGELNASHYSSKVR